MSGPEILEIRQEAFLEIEGAETLLLEVGERQIEIVDVGIAGPQGPAGPMPELASDPLAYYILAKN